MKRLLAGFVLLAVAVTALAQPRGHSDAEGKYKAKFPGAPKVSKKETSTALGDLTVVVAVYANSDRNTFMVSYTDFPADATKPENAGTLLDGMRNGVKGDNGKLVGTEKKNAFGPNKLPMREFVVDKDDPKQRIKCRVILRDNRVYQLAVIGTNDFVGGKDATAFLDSFELK